MANNLKLSLEVVAKGTERTVAELIKLQKAIADAAKEGNAVDGLGNAFDKVAKSGAGLSGFATNVPKGIAATAFAFNQVVQALGMVQAAASQAYGLLIGQNLELQKQLLGTQSSLAATNKVLVDGVQIKDPTKAIQALEGPVKDAVQRVRQGSLELVGVTSAQLIPLFQIIATQSSQIGANLDQSADLSLSFAAALGTLGIPLEMARQEINSILTGQITSDSQLAKSIGLNNEQVKKWKEQGTLVDNLNKKLEAFKAGNALAAKTIDGVSSNIMELVQEFTRIAGEPFMGPIVEQLDQVYQFLNDNKDAILAFAQVASEQFLIFAEAVGESVVQIAEALLPALQNLGPIAVDVIKLVGEGFRSLAAGAAVLAEALGPALTKATELAGKLVEAVRKAQEGFALLNGGFNQSTEAVETAGQVTAQLSQNAIALQGKLKAAIDAKNQAQKDGRKLTDDEVKANKALEVSRQGAIQGLEEWLRALNEQVPIGEENTRSLETQKNEIKARIAALKSDSLALSDNAKKVTLVADANTAATQSLQSVQSGLKAGTTSEAEALKQLQAIANNAEVEIQTRKEASQQITAIRKNQNDAELAALAAQRSQIESRVKAGTLSEAAAEQELTKIREQEIQKRIALNKQQQGTANTESEKQKLIAEEKQLQAELANVQAETANQQNQRSLENFDEQRSILEGQFAQGKVSRTEYNRQLLDIDLKKNDEELRQLQEQLSKLSDTDTEGREAINAKIAAIYAKRADIVAQANARELQALEQANDKALDESKLAETQRNIEIEKQVQDGTLTHEEAEKLKAKATLSRIDAELEAERKKFALLSKQKSSNPEDEAKRLDAMRGAQQRIADLTLQRLQSQKTAEKDLQKSTEDKSKKEIDAIESARKLEDIRSRERILNLTKETQALDRQSQLQQLAAKSVEREQRLGQAAYDLTKARSDAEQNRYSAQISGLNQAIDLVRQYNAEDDPTKKAQQKQLLSALGIDSQAKELALLQQRQALEDAQAQAKQKALLAEQEAARKNLEFAAKRAEIEARQQLIAAKRAEYEAQITLEKSKQSVVDAQAELKKAKKVEDPEERKTAIAEANQNIKEAQQSVSVAQDGVVTAKENRQFAEQNIEDTKKIFEDQRQSLEVQQQAQLEIANTENGLRQMNQAIELYKSSQDGGTQATQAFTAAIQKATQAAGTIGSVTGASPTPRRYGGDVGAGQPYLVGESGREIFIPAQNGWILNRWEADRLAREALSAGQLAGLAQTSGAVRFSPSIPVPMFAGTDLKREFAELKKEVRSLGTGMSQLANTPRQFQVNESEDGMRSALRLQREMMRWR